MKTRQGFVSNSSTSSFCIYGAEVEKQLVIDFMEFISEKDPKAKDRLSKFNDCEYLAYVDIIETFLGEETGQTFSVHYLPDYEDSCYIGRAYSSIEDNETGNEFKNSVKDTINKYFGKTLKVGNIERAFND